MTSRRLASASKFPPKSTNLKGPGRAFFISSAKGHDAAQKNRGPISEPSPLDAIALCVPSCPLWLKVLLFRSRAIPAIGALCAPALCLHPSASGPPGGRLLLQTKAQVQFDRTVTERSKLSFICFCRSNRCHFVLLFLVVTLCRRFDQQWVATSESRAAQ